MPKTFKAETLTEIAGKLLIAGGMTERDAAIVSNHLSGANLAGHDSHGIIRIIQYMESIEKGTVAPAGCPRVIRESKCAAQIDGDKAFGQVAFAKALELAIDKARLHGAGLVAMSNHDHTGRIGHYAEEAARQDMAAFVCCGKLGSAKLGECAPFGGLEARLGTNPIAMAFPYLPDAPILLDFATSVAPEGKIRVSRARGESLPDDWVISNKGKPSNRPEDYYAGGTILPLGGWSGGHKGYALSFMTVIFAGILSHLGVNPDIWDGSFLLIFDPQNFIPLESISTHVANTVKAVKNTPLQDGVSEILVPGEREARIRRQRLKNGIQVEDSTWRQISNLMKLHGIKVAVD